MRILWLILVSRSNSVVMLQPMGIADQGITAIRRKSRDMDIEELSKICSDYNVELIISGLPKNMNGTLGPQSEKVMDFCDFIYEKIKIPIKMWDERLTTVAANRAMLEADLSRAKRKKIVDKLAATYILQGYLDSIYVSGVDR